MTLNHVYCEQGARVEEDGTEIDEEEYFNFLPSHTRLIILSVKEMWSPMDSMQG